MRFHRILLALVLVTAVSAFAQHGGGHGMGAGGGMGASSSHDMGSANGHGSSGMANQSPDKVLSHNTAIASKIKNLTGQDASTACDGFKNLGQCVAAAHVSQNLGITFSDLKAKMTGSSPESLGKAIQDLKPSANAKTESKKANKQAQQDINDSNS